MRVLPQKPSSVNPGAQLSLRPRVARRLDELLAAQVWPTTAADFVRVRLEFEKICSGAQLTLACRRFLEAIA